MMLEGFKLGILKTPVRKFIARPRLNNKAFYPPLADIIKVVVRKYQEF
jgi:hypothetical protein